MALTQVTGSTGVKKPVDFADNEKARFGTGNDLEIYHDGNNSFIKDTGTGSLKIATNQLQLTNAADNEVMLSANQDGEVQLCFNGIGKLNTKSDGIDVTGEVQCDSLDVDGLSEFSNRVTVDRSAGTQSCFSARHNGTENALIKADGSATFAGEVECGSLDLNGDADFGGGKINFDESGNVLDFADNVAARFGSGNDLQIFHNGTNSTIQTSNSSAGDLVIEAKGTNHDLYLQATDDIFIRPANGEAGIVVSADGAVELFHNNNLRFQTDASATTMRGGGQHRCEGHFRPWANNTYDLGTSGDRWRNVYTNDLHLSNEGSTNDVDGTWGSFTIQEGEDDLFLINRRTGKKYKFNLTEVN